MNDALGKYEKNCRCDRADCVGRYRWCAGANLSIASDHAGGAVPAGGSTDVAARIMPNACAGRWTICHHRKYRRCRRLDRGGRVARAQPDGYTFDIGQWDTHVGSIIYKLDYDLQKDFEPIGLVSNNPQLMVAKKDLPANI